MNPRQHISKHHWRVFDDALLPGGIWHLGRLISRLFAEPCPAGVVAYRATNVPAMRKRVFIDARKA